MTYQFDAVVDRSGNHSAKYDERKKKFGTEDVIPLWIADMDFKTAQPIIDALKARAEEGIWGYTGLAEAPQWLGHRPVPHELQPGRGADPVRLREAVHPGGWQRPDSDAGVLRVL